MSVAIKLSGKLIDDAKRNAKLSHRSVPKQIEYWSHIGKIVEENPDLPYSFIKDILFAREEFKRGEVEVYVFDKDKG